MLINRNALLILISTCSVITAQTAAPTPASSIVGVTPSPTTVGTQAQGTPAPSPVVSQAQGTPAPTPADTVAASTLAPTTEPPTRAPTAPTTNSPTRSLGRPECNICGEGTDNLIGEPNAVVNFPDPDSPEVMRRFPCSAVQRLVNTRNVYKREDVCSYIFDYTYATCRCATREGQLLSDLLAPTISPGPAENPTSQSGGGNGDQDEDGSGGASLTGFLAILAATVATAVVSL